MLGPLPAPKIGRGGVSSTKFPMDFVLQGNTEQVVTRLGEYCIYQHLLPACTWWRKGVCFEKL